MESLTNWRQRLRKHLEANLHDTSSAVNENQWQFGPAIVTLYPDSASVFVTVTRAFEHEHPELTGQRWERRFSTSDDAEVAALEIARFIHTLR